jgi:hypothetical protein
MPIRGCSQFSFIFIALREFFKALERGDRNHPRLSAELSAHLLCNAALRDRQARRVRRRILAMLASLRKRRSRAFKTLHPRRPRRHTRRQLAARPLAAQVPPMTFDPTRVRFVASVDDVRARHPAMMSRASGKILPALDRHCRAILDHATFCVVSTQDRAGRADASPRGDPAGFVRVLDDRHLLLPDRIGNNRFDSIANLFENPAIGVMFLVPGMAEVLRINGRGRVTDDADLLAGSAVQGRAPRIAILIEVQEAFLHCAKAINRAGLWDGSRHIDRATLPSYGDMLADQVAGLTREESDRQGAEMARRGMY